MFLVLPINAFAQSLPLPTWTGSFTYQGTQYTYTMVGTDPAGGGTMTIPVYLVPLKITIGSVVYDPATVLSSVLSSPIFCTPSGSNQCTIAFTSGGQDFGVTQYLDAYQRANFWVNDSSNNYHLLLGTPVVINESLNPPTPSD